MTSFVFSAKASKNKIVRLNDLNLNKLPLIKINLTPVTPYVETSESHLHQFSLNM